MKVFLIAFLLGANVAFANMEFQNGKMSVNLNSEPLTSVLQDLQQQTGIKVSVEPNAASQNVSAIFSNLPVAAGIKKILEGTGINYVVVADGDRPTALFIGSSLNPDAAAGAPNGANGMPNRGVVTPVSPLPPPPPQPEIRAVQPDNTQGGRKTITPGVNIPTGGGFVPNAPNTPNKPNYGATNPNAKQVDQQSQPSDQEEDEQDDQEQ